MWAADRVVAPTPGSAITIPETANEFAIKGNIIKILYHGLSEITQEVLNAAAGGIFLYKTPNQAYQLLEDKTYGSLPSNTQPKPRGGNSKAYQPSQARNEHVNVVFTRSGKSYNPPDNPADQQNNSENPINFDSDDEDDEPTPQPKTQPTKPVKEPLLPKPYKPKISSFQCPVGVLTKNMLFEVVIRFKHKQLNLGVGIEQMIFNIDSAMKHSYSNDDTCFSIDEILEEDSDALLDEGSKILHSIEGTLLEEEIFSEFDEFVAMTADENSESESPKNTFVKSP
ncbi:hypothetical protein Tco_0722990 [Tanacetum coccineum]